VTVGAIAGHACGAPSPRYAAMTAKSGGRMVSICGDVSSAMASLGELITSREVIVLDGRPEPASLEVVIEDQMIEPAFFTWVEQDNAVVLSPLVRPGPGGEVLIRYLPLCL
jgi:hypothetical protein